MHTILIIEDDADIARNIAEYLKGIDPTLTTLISRDGFDGFSQAAGDDRIDLAVLDVGLPGMDGIEVCKRLRAVGWEKPIIILTALDTVPDRVRGLESGADDYLVKPFSLAELHARIRAQLRRHDERLPQTLLRVADLKLDLSRWEATRAGNPVKLSANAMKVLACLMKKSPAVVTREELAHEVWNDRLPSAETIRSHVYMVRNAVDAGYETPLIHTVQGVGWTVREK